MAKRAKVEPEVQQSFETDKITTMEPVAPAQVDTQNGAGMIEITGEAIGEITSSIAESVGSGLHKIVADEITNGVELLTITDNAGYLKACEHRKKLKGLVNAEGNPQDPERLKFRIVLMITDKDGKRIGVSLEDSCGMKSAEDFYGPIADKLYNMHRAITGGRKELVDQIEAVRKLQETSILAWDAKQAEIERQEKERQRLINEQNERKAHAWHWANELSSHGFSVDQVRELAGCDFAEIDAAGVERLRSKLETVIREKQEAEIRRQQEEEEARRKADYEQERREVAEAAETARKHGFNDLADELEGKMKLSEETNPEDVEYQEIFSAPLMSVSHPVYVTPPPQVMPVQSAVATRMAPKAAGTGKKQTWILEITNPKDIPAEFLLPVEGNLYNVDFYPRIRNLMNIEGKSLMARCPGIKITPKDKLTQR